MEQCGVETKENRDWIKRSDFEELLLKYNELKENYEDVEMKLLCLEHGGVDNWTWYDESMEEYWKWKKLKEKC